MALENIFTNIYIIIGCSALLIMFLTKKYFAGGACKSANRLDGKTVIITGANTGIGKETAVELAKRGARVIMACRDMEKGQIAAKEVIQKSRNTNVYLKKLDLASFASIRAFSADILKTESRLDILINNAGQGVQSPRKTTENGFEFIFGINHLGHFLLTNLLLDLLKKCAPSRIINVSSMSHKDGRINFDDLNSEKEYSSYKAYAQSKLANVLFTRELVHRLKETQVTAYSLHPGVVLTDIFRNIRFISCLRVLFSPLVFLFVKTPLQGAQTTIHLAVADVEKYNGLYFADCVVSKMSKAAQDDGMAKKLWEVSEEMVGL